MKKSEFEELDKEIIEGSYNWQKIDKLPFEVQNALSRIYAERHYEKVIPDFENEPRDWRQIYPKPHICGLHGEGMYFIHYLTIGSSAGVVSICMSSEFTERFRSKAKLDSFIYALTQARNSAFPK